MRKQQLFNTENAAFFYLSPYAKMIPLSGNSVLFVRQDLSKSVLLECESEDKLQNLVSRLETGLSKEDFLALLGELDENKNELFAVCIRNGVIE